MTEFGRRGRRSRYEEDEGSYQIPRVVAPDPIPSESTERDIELVCQDCRRTFTFTVGEQRFFRERIGPEYRVPKRCKECRAVKKQNKQP